MIPILSLLVALGAVAVMVIAWRATRAARLVAKGEGVPRCQDSCRLIGFIKTINRGRKEPCNAALFT